MILYKHLRDARGAPEVPVDLERRVRAEEVGVRSTPATHLDFTVVHRLQQAFQ